MNYKITIYTFLLLLAISLSGLSIYFSNINKTYLPEQKKGQPDAFLEKITAISLNKLGQINFKLEAPNMVHYLESDRAEFLEPQILIFRDSLEPWQIKSLHAETKNGTNEIIFWDNVHIKHATDDKILETNITTNHLTLLPNKKIVKTNEFITLSQPNVNINAIGMLANLDTGNIQLFSSVRETHDQPF